MAVPSLPELTNQVGSQDWGTGKQIRLSEGTLWLSIAVVHTGRQEILLTQPSSQERELHLTSAVVPGSVFDTYWS